MMSVFKIRETEQMFSSVSGRRDSASIQGLFATWKIVKKKKKKKKKSGPSQADFWDRYWGRAGQLLASDFP